MGAVPIIDARGMSLRHIHPTSRFPSQGGAATILGRSYGFTWLPISSLPHSHDLVEGTHTMRLGDSGEWSLTFPNAVGGLGPWRDRFSADRALEFVEVYRDDALEFVGSVQRVEVDRGQVTVSGTDAWALLRRAYERDRSWTAAPQEVVQAYTRVPVTRLADDFPGSSLGAGWTIRQDAGETITVTVANGLAHISGSGSDSGGIVYDVGAVLGDTWRATVVIARVGSPTPLNFGIDMKTPTNDVVLRLLTSPSSSSGASITSFDDLGGNSVNVFRDEGGESLPKALTIERRGRWASAYINRLLIGVVPFQSVEGVDRIEVRIVTSVSGSAYVDSALVTELQGFLTRGSDKGDYVLPGGQPTGGLRGRYFNNSDLQGLAAATRRDRILAPDREPYAERLDPVVNTGGGLAIPVQPGSPTTHFSVRWFGSVYLRLDLGNYLIQVSGMTGGARIWVGKTGWGDQLVDAWTLATPPVTAAATISAATLGSRAGWYPIIVEYHHDTGTAALSLDFDPPSGYTDPGGTALSGALVPIPSTSLSPLGCFDNRVQGTSHFDLVGQAAAAFGYQLLLEPMSLESGEFPGRLVPRVRVGRDTDVELEVDDTDGVEPALNPGATLDGSDQALTLIGSGSGIADGRGSQTLAEVTNLTDVAGGLFSLEAWVDAGDIAFPDLLAARLNAELGLRDEVWEEVRATPRAQDRLADTWPLSGTLAAMRWRPGDGVRLSVPDVGVEDTTPRQITQVTRTFAAEGRTGAQVAFRQRPRSGARALRGHLRGALALGRSYQRQLITLQGEYIVSTVAAGGFSGYSRLTLLPGDAVVRAVFRIVINTTSQTIGLEVNGTDRTAALGGGWSTIPTEIDITGYATQATATDNRLYGRMQNNGASSSIVEGLFIVEVLR